MTLLPKTPLRFGILGCGTIATTHAGALQAITKASGDATLTAVCDVIADRAAAVATAFRVPKVYRTEEALLSDLDIDVVCLCTPSGDHMAQAVRAMEAGKHVVSEKPMDVSVEACDKAIAAEDATGKKLAIISQHRWDPATITVKDAIASGALGKIVLVSAAVPWYRTQAYYDSGDWRGTWAMDGGGALMNQGVHTVDVMLHLAGDVETVSANYIVGAAHERIEVEDVVTASLRFASGAIGTLYATTAAYDGFPVRIEIFGTDGTAIIEGDRLKTLQTKSGLKLGGEEAATHAAMVAKGGTAAARLEPIWGDSHQAQFEDLIQAIQTGTKPKIDGREGRRPLRLIDAVYRSARTGFPVNL